MALQEEGLLRLPQIIGRPAVTEEQAARNREAAKRAKEAIDAARGKAELTLAKRALGRVGPRRARPATPGLIPVRPTAWWVGVRAGRYPKPIKLGKRVAAWRVEDIRALIEGRWKPEASQ